MGGRGRARIGFCCWASEFENAAVEVYVLFCDRKKAALRVCVGKLESSLYRGFRWQSISCYLDGSRYSSMR